MRLLVRVALLLLATGALVAFWLGQTQAATTTVPIGATFIYGPFWYCDAAHSGVVCTTTITVGDTVTWQNNTSVYHTSTECDGVCGTIPGSPIWDSGLIAPSGSYSRQFNTLGTFNYQCNVHPDQMKGQIVVQAAGPTATITSTPQATPTFTPVPAVGGISIDPGVGALPASSGRNPGTLAGIIAATAAAAIALGSAVWYTRRRRVQ
jgi:hypothetical protein